MGTDLGDFVNDRRSTIGCGASVECNLVTWRYKKQSGVTLLNIEAEFCALS